jgi:hypothetical protein
MLITVDSCLEKAELRRLGRRACNILPTWGDDEGVDDSEPGELERELPEPCLSLGDLRWALALPETVGMSMDDDMMECSGSRAWQVEQEITERRTASCWAKSSFNRVL